MKAIIGRLALLAVAALVVVGPPRNPAQAESYEYTPKKRQLKACILLLDSSNLENPDPYVFHVLDTKGAALKPRDWEIVNPLAPRVVTPDIKARWDAIDSANPYTLNQPITKNMACYWEVRLSEVKPEDLLQFDLIFFTNHDPNAGFLPSDTAALRRAVDLGAVFWLDNCAGMKIDTNKRFFINQVNFDETNPDAPPSPEMLSIADTLHPALNSPFRLSRTDIEQLGDKADPYRYRIVGQDQPYPDPVLAPIVYSKAQWGGVGGFPVIAGGHYGDGVVVVSGMDIGCAINDYFGAGAFYNDVALSAAQQARLDCNMKFVFNLLNWTAGEANYRKGAHRAAYTRDEVTPGVDALWKVPLCPNADGGAVPYLPFAPVVWRDFVFFATGERQADNNWTCHVFCADSNPGLDRDGLDDSGLPNDGLGNPNDGTPAGWVDPKTHQPVSDLTGATPYDIIWRVDMPNLREPPSPMYAATVVVDTDGNAATPPEPLDLVFFTTVDNTGIARLHALRAAYLDPSSGKPVLADHTANLYGAGLQLNTAALGADGAVSAPVVSRGNVYVLSREWDATTSKYRYYVYAIDAATGTSAFNYWTTAAKFYLGVETTGDTTALPQLSVGLVPNEKFGSTADIVYASLATGDIVGMPMHVYEEKPTLVTDAAAGVTRATLQHAVPVDPRADAAHPSKYADDGEPKRTNLMVTVYDLDGEPIGASNPNPQHRWIPHVTAPDNTQSLVIQKRTLPDATNPYGLPDGPLPAGYKVVVEYAVYVPASMRIWRQDALGYSATATGLMSGVALSADDRGALATYNGFVEAVEERGQGGTQPSDPNQVLWRYNVNNYAPTDTMTPPTGYARVDAAGNATNQTWAPAAWRLNNPADATSTGHWEPLPPAVAGDIIYVAMNRVAPGATPTDPPTIVEGAVFAFDRRQVLYVDTGWQKVANFAMTDHPKLWQYAPELATPGWRPVRSDCYRVFPQTRLNPVDGSAENRCVFQINSFNCDVAGTDAPLTVCPTLPVWVDPGGTGVAKPDPGSLGFLINGGDGNLIWRYPDVGTNRGTAASQVDWASGVGSAPTVSGGVLYVTTGNGALYAFDADPRDSEQPAGGTPVGALPRGVRLMDDGINDYESGLLSIRMPPSHTDTTIRVLPDVLGIWRPATAGACPGGVTATGGLLLMPRTEPNAGVLYALSRPVYAVADARRGMEVDGDGRILSVLAESRGDAEERALNHPAAARFAPHLSSDARATIYADTGNNRVVAVNGTGDVVWEATEVYDLDNVLPGGEFEVASRVSVPFAPAYDADGDGRADAFTASGDVRVSKLRTPTDVRSWESFDANADGTPNTNVLVKHTLIADAGNYRVLEIVDKWEWFPAGRCWIRMRRTDPGHGNPYWYHVVAWASQTRARHQDYGGSWRAGQNYRYTSIQVVDYAPRSSNANALVNRTGVGYAGRVLCTIANYALYRAGGRRNQRTGSSLVMLDGNPTYTAATGAWTCQSTLVDTTDEQGYTCAIGKTVDPADTADVVPHLMTGQGSIQRYFFGWTPATGRVWHYIYADGTGIYEFQLKPGAAGRPPQLPIDAAGCLDKDYIYAQFWAQHYWRLCLGRTDAFRPGAVQFQPGSVTVDPAGGWVVTNRVFDRALSSYLSSAAVGRAEDARRIQVFKVAGAPRPTGDYDATEANFGYTAGSIRYLFGPQLHDLRQRDLKTDLAQPMYVVRSR